MKKITIVSTALFVTLTLSLGVLSATFYSSTALAQSSSGLDCTGLGESAKKACEEKNKETKDNITNEQKKKNDKTAADRKAAEAKARCENATFLTLPAWYNGLATYSEAEAECSINSPNDAGGVSNFVWIIVLNVVEMLLRAAAYAAVAFIIYGGYKYMISAGSSDGMVAARKTIMNACIGLIISLAAVAIVNTISGGMKL